jgi:hypothetical protein
MVVLIDLFTYLLQAAQSFLRSQPVFNQLRHSPHFMVPEDSLPHSQVPATCHYPELCVNIAQQDIFYGEELLAPPQSPSWRTTRCRLSATAFSINNGGHSCIRNLRTHHAVVTGTNLPRGMKVQHY